jgi:uncharacterized protein YebE (UPF0316 family)
MILMRGVFNFVVMVIVLSLVIYNLKKVSGIVHYLDANSEQQAIMSMLN